jgi:putative transposase
MHKTHKIRLKPTPTQVSYFARACGVARFAWNWALEQWNRQYQEGGKPNEADLRKQLNVIKRKQFPWMLEVTKYAPARAIQNLGTAFQRFFAGQAQRPRFKRKGVHDSFLAGSTGGNCRCEGKWIRLPNIGWVRMRQELRFPGRLISATVSRTVGRWFVSILGDTPESAPTVSENQATVGIDLGVKVLATCSDGETIPNPQPLHRALKRLKRLARQASRKQQGSQNRRKAKERVARQHYRVACIRKNALHQATTRIVRKEVSVIVLEDLNVRGMMANHKLARAISDVGMGEFRRQLEYKAQWSGKVVVLADRFYPSSKRCSRCGHCKDDLPLSERVFRCAVCGLVLDRDLNAARNLARWPQQSRSTPGLGGMHACGDRSSSAADPSASL